MNIGTWLQASTAILVRSGVSSARLDCLLLLEDGLACDRSWILAHPEHELRKDIINVLDDLVTVRSTHKPLAQLRGRCEFYGRTFQINEHVLQPRPETETMIELLLEICTTDIELPTSPINDSGIDGNSGTHRPAGHACSDAQVAAVHPETAPSVLRIADVGTGSGALGITAQLELPGAVVDLLDCDELALEIAKMNVINHTTAIPTFKTNLLDGSSNDYDILLCNLPYVPDAYPINKAARFEPAVALFGGASGLDLYYELFGQIKIVEKKPLYILFESLASQHKTLQTLSENNSYNLVNSRDLIQVFKRSSV